MNPGQTEQEQPIKVVLFGGGPRLERGVRRFVCRLEAQTEVAFLGAFCQAPGQTYAAVVRDTWQRRGLLAGPLLAAQTAGELASFVRQPRAEIVLRSRLAALADRIWFVPDIHAPAVLERVHALAPDLGLIYGSPILKPALFEIPRLGTLGIHHGQAPEYRGKKTTFWAIFNGEASAGVTIQRVNARLDGGDIVKQGAVPTGQRSLGKVWRELEQLGLDLYMEAILEVRQGTASYRPQIGQPGRLYRDPAFRDLLAYWRRRWLRRREQAAGANRPATTR